VPAVRDLAGALMKQPKEVLKDHYALKAGGYNLHLLQWLSLQKWAKKELYTVVMI
jgi:hypothetical protein